MQAIGRGGPKVAGQRQARRQHGRPAAATRNPAGCSHPPAARSIYAGSAPRHVLEETAEVVAAVETLYNDQIRPYSRILRKRLGERAPVSAGGTDDIDLPRVRALCEASPWLCVQTDEGGSDWSVLHRFRPTCFVDVYSPQDVYPPELWQAAASYFSTLGEDDVLPGGRYLCAKELASRGLGFLVSCSLGQVCHIVQLSLSQKKVLGYLNGSIVPYGRSQSMIKEHCAQRRRPCAGSTRAATRVANWDEVYRCVRELVGSLPPGEWMSLSNVKRLFLSRFGLTLSETALGYAKLSELFQDARLSSLCTVQLKGQGYVLMPIARPAPCMQISFATSLPAGVGIAVTSPPVEAPQRAESHGPAGGTSLQDRAWWIKPLTLEEATPGRQSPPLAPASSDSQHSAPVSREGDAELQLFPPTPSPSCAYTLSLPRLLGATRPRAGSGVGKPFPAPWAPVCAGGLTGSAAEHPAMLTTSKPGNHCW